MAEVIVTDYVGAARTIEMETPPAKEVAFRADQQYAEARQFVAAGGAIAVALPFPTAPRAIVSVLAFVTATGAPAAKTLLAETVDYTLSATGLVWVTGQAANTVVVTYRPLTEAEWEHTALPSHQR